MSEASENFPQDYDSLKAFTLSVLSENKHLKLQVEKLQRHCFGRRAETLSVDQLTFLLNEQTDKVATEHKSAAKASSEKSRPSRKPLPAHLPREEQHHQPDGADQPCSHCGGQLRFISNDVSEMLEYVPARFKVIRHVRAKWGCKCCNTITQAPAPERPIAQGLPGPDLLAQVMVSKYCDHLPLYRQSMMYAREGVDLACSTLGDWIAKGSFLLSPLVAAIHRHVLDGETIHADDTPVPVLDPGRGRTKPGRFWTYVRDESPRGSLMPAAVWFAYTPDRRGIHPQTHLKHFSGIIHADGYAGFNALYNAGHCVEASCWAHVRRKFYDVYDALKDDDALQALLFIRQLYDIEEAIRGKPPDERQQFRQIHAVSLLAVFRQWLEKALTRHSRKSDLSLAIRYALSRWTSLTRYCDDGRIEVDNNAAERALRAIAVGRKNYLFAGSDTGGERAAALYSLIGTAKLNGIDPMAYLRHVLAVIGTHPINRIDELLPWNVELPLTRSHDMHPLSAAA